MQDTSWGGGGLRPWARPLTTGTVNNLCRPKNRENIVISLCSINFLNDNFLILIISLFHEMSGAAKHELAMDWRSLSPDADDEINSFPSPCLIQKDVTF